MSTDEFVQDEVIEAELAEVHKPSGTTYGMVKNYVGICHALGIKTRNMNPMDLYLTGGKVFDALRQYHRTGDAIDIIKSLTKEQRLAVRDRVLGVVPIPNTVSGSK
jgi:hypothetical protein